MRLEHAKIAVVLAVSLAAMFHVANSCSEAVCASIASKCMLTGSCNCDTANLTNCTCCKDCALCLDRLYEECCSCFKLCPEPSFKWVSLGMHSEVEEYEESSPELFQLLTEQEDAKKRWVTYTFPVDHKLFSSKHSKTYKIKLVPVDSEGREQVAEVTGGADPSASGGKAPADVEVTLNCTVAFLSQCRAREKCSLACRTMGSNAFRWFHNGCCECIGDTCINFGMKESRCPHCSDDEQEHVPDVTMDAALAVAYGGHSGFSESRDFTVQRLKAQVISGDDVSNELKLGD